MKKSENNSNLEQPGQQLSRSRESKGLSIETVAEQLRLSPGSISAIENDEYNFFPAMAYARGYTRSYASLLGIDPDTISQAFDHFAGSAPVLEPSVSQADPQIGSDHKYVKIISYVLIAIMLVLLFLWWQGRETITEEPISLDPEDLTIAPESVDEVLIEDPFATADTIPEPATATTATPPAEIFEHEVVYFSPLPEVPDYSDQSKAAPEQQVDQQDPVSEPELIEVGDTFPQATTSPEPFAGGDLVMQSSGVSWVEIYDAMGSKIYFGMTKSGENVSLSGVPPYRVVIGKSSVTTLIYAGNPVDLNSVSNGDVARFTLDETGARRERFQ